MEFNESTNNKLNQFKQYVDGCYKKINNFNIFSNNLKLETKAEDSFLIYEKRLKKKNLIQFNLNLEIDSLLFSILDNSFVELCKQIVNIFLIKSCHKFC